MKRHSFYSLLAAIAALLLALPSCKPALKSSAKIYLDENPVSYKAKSYFVEVEASGDWTLDLMFNDGDEEWATIKPTIGSGSKNNVILRVKSNDGEADRSCLITIVSNGAINFVELVQHGWDTEDPEEEDPDNPGEGGGDNPVEEIVPGEGTEESPYSVAKALELIDANTIPENEVYVKGIITSITEISTNYGNATYKISDDGTMSDELIIFRGKYLDGENFTEESELKAGDRVVVLGTLKLYNSDREMTSGNKLISRTPAGSGGNTGGGNTGGGNTGGGNNDESVAATNAKWLELPATNVNDGLVFVNHTMTDDKGNKNARDYSYYYDRSKYAAIWVAYPLCKAYAKKSQDRSNAWGFDPKMPEDAQPSLKSSYKGSIGGNNAGYDRGHQLPSADRVFSAEGNKHTFYYTNMTPQLAGFNQKDWATLEGKVRSWADNCDTLYVVTGCDFTGWTKVQYDNASPQKACPVPTSYYKAVLRKKGTEYRAIGIWMEHVARSRGISKSDVMSIDALEAKVGIDFFVNLPDVVGTSMANQIEAADPTKDTFWGIY